MKLANFEIVWSYLKNFCSINHALVDILRQTLTANIQSSQCIPVYPSLHIQKCVSRVPMHVPRSLQTAFSQGCKCNHAVSQKKSISLETMQNFRLERNVKLLLLDRLKCRIIIMEKFLNVLCYISWSPMGKKICDELQLNVIRK